jgi:hypothetical protein
MAEAQRGLWMPSSRIAKGKLFEEMPLLELRETLWIDGIFLSILTPANVFPG